MEEYLNYAKHLPVFIAAILVGHYLIPAGMAYLYFSRRSKQSNQGRRIQKRLPKINAIQREIKWSLISVLIFSVLTMTLFYFVKLGYTRVYFNISDYGWIYFIISPVICIVLHDSYFYWTHRFMHWKKIFSFVHSVHHRSNPPTPWAILSFGPIECLILYSFYFLIVFFFPIHPVAAAIFVLYNIILNTGGHLGYEIVTERMFKHPILKYGLTVTHHDMHHSKGNCNYGLYFNFWDRIMGTNSKLYEKKFMSSI